MNWLIFKNLHQKLKAKGPVFILDRNVLCLKFLKSEKLVNAKLLLFLTF
jgi:hypothetical protein